jgi:hypothetical protein
MRPILAAALGSALALGAAPAGAQTHAAAHAGPAAAPSAPPLEPTPAQRAAKLRDDGNDAMMAMRYADALTAYRAAADLLPDDAGLLYSIARAEQFLGDYPRALEALEAFQAHATPEARAKVGKLDDLFAEIRPRVSTLDLKCSVPGARVLVRDKVVGSTPLPPTRIASGASTLQVELDGFFPDTRNVVFPGGGNLSLDVALHPKATSGALAIASDPLGATIQVDGQAVGTASPRVELALPAGPHEVLAHYDGYDDAKVSLLVSPGGERDVTVPLQKSRSVLTRWWFWTSVGVVVAGGVALTYALSTEKSADHGTLSPGQVGGP